MSKYVGKRIVPKHCGYWDNTKPYEMECIVYDRNSGNSYISRKAVPAGTDISQEEYWALCSDFNEQMALLDQHITESEAAIKADNDATEVAIMADNNQTKAAIMADNDATEAAVQEESAATKRYVDNSLALLNSKVSSPFEVAATVSAMTDRAKAYVYIGNENGYTVGGWYYHNGTNWVMGGTAVDPTLTIAGAPADAAATGEIYRDALMPRGTVGTTILDTNLDHYITPGIFRVSAYANEENWPISVRGILVVLRSNQAEEAMNRSAYIVQLAIGGHTMLYRLGASATGSVEISWSAWFDLNRVPDTTLSVRGLAADALSVSQALGRKLGIASGLTHQDDLDSLLEIGIYSAIGTELPANYPFSIGGIIVVASGFDNQSIGWRSQTAFCADGVAWRYQRSTSEWTAWQTLGTKAELSNATRFVGGAPVPLNSSLEWVQGGMHSETGESFYTPTRVRSVLWPVPIGALNVYIDEPSLKLFVFKYDAKTKEFLGCSGWLYPGDRYTVNHGETVSFELAYSDDSAITPEDNLPEVWAKEELSETIDGLMNAATFVGGVKTDISKELFFTQGAISSATGDITPGSSTRIHTGSYRNVPVGRMRIGHESMKHKLFVFRYDARDGAYLGSSSWLAAGEGYDVYQGEAIRLVLAFKDDAEINPEMEIPPIYVTAEREVSDTEKISGLPILYLTGDISEMSKENKVFLNYSLFGKAGTCSCKWQGSSSLRYPKKNYTISSLEPAIDAWALWARWVNSWREQTGNISRISTTSKWGIRDKFCLKANWIDPSAARNIVCARLWGQVVSSRNQVSGRLDQAPNYGAIDGFPVCLMINNRFAGLYTLNVPKDAYTFAMGEGGTEYLVGGESNSEQACRWKALSSGSGEDGDDYEIEYAPSDVGSGSVIGSLNEAISKVMSSHADWETECGDYVDIESVIDYFIFVNCVGAHDNLARNVLYGTYDGKKWFMSAYDLDATFGADPYGTGWFETVNDRNQFKEAASIHRLCYLICKYSSAKLVARYKELRTGILSDDHVWYELIRFIADIPESIYTLDREKWPSMPGTSTANLHQYMEFYRMHCAYLDQEIAGLEALLNAGE